MGELIPFRDSRLWTPQRLAQIQELIDRRNIYEETAFAFTELNIEQLKKVQRVIALLHGGHNLIIDDERMAFMPGQGG